MKTGEGWLAVWPVAAFFLGGLATQLAGFITHQRQRREKTEDAQAEVRRRREEFELAHLVECNQLLRQTRAALGEFVNALASYHPSTVAGAPDVGLGRVFTDACNLFQAAHSDLSSQEGFIFDDEVRRLVGVTSDGMMGKFEQKLFSESPGDVSMNVDGDLNAAYAVLSARVRTIYAGQGA